LFLFLCGTWLIVWILIALSHSGNSYYCAVCGFSSRPKSQSGNPLIIVVVILGFLFVVGAVCSLSKRSSSSPSETSVYTPPPITAASTPVQKTSIPQKQPKTSAVGKAAVVISENANLRMSSETSGEIVGVLPYGSSVEVLKQKGAWFLVRAGTQEGWLHGNTIRLEDTY
jgi:hypothetical protein